MQLCASWCISWLVCICTSSRKEFQDFSSLESAVEQLKHLDHICHYTHTAAAESFRQHVGTFLFFAGLRYFVTPP